MHFLLLKYNFIYNSNKNPYNNDYYNFNTDEKNEYYKDKKYFNSLYILFIFR